MVSADIQKCYDSILRPRFCRAPSVTRRSPLTGAESRVMDILQNALAEVVQRWISWSLPTGSTVSVRKTISSTGGQRRTDQRGAMGTRGNGTIATRHL